MVFCDTFLASHQRAFLSVVGAAAVALMMTGLAHADAAFHALSTFSAAGFTTGESELVIARWIAVAWTG